MCREDTNTLALPAQVIETLAQYRRLLDERGWDWGDEQIDLFRWARFTQFAAELTLASRRCARWSVTDASGGAWFPDGVLAKWDFHHRPFFHGHDVTLTVPAEMLEVVCTRGLEFDREVREVIPSAGERVTVECEPVRLI